MRRESYDQNGVLRERWDDTTRTYTAWDANGVQTQLRPYSAAENAEADERQANLDAENAAAARAAEDEAILTAIAETATPPPDGAAWVQPTGAQDAYPVNAKVTHAGKSWISIVAYNVWEPGVSGWREQPATGYPAWVQPTGAQDAYPAGARVTHNGQNWESTTPDNVWEPGVFGWVVI